MNLIDLDAIFLAKDEQPYRAVVNELKTKLSESLLTQSVESTGEEIKSDRIRQYGQLVTLKQAITEYLDEQKQYLIEAIYREHKTEAAKGVKFEHAGGYFVLSSSPVYNYLAHDFAEQIVSPSGKIVRRKPLQILHSRLDKLNLQVKSVKEQISAREKEILTHANGKIKPDSVKQVVRYI